MSDVHIICWIKEYVFFNTNSLGLPLYHSLICFKTPYIYILIINFPDIHKSRESYKNGSQNKNCRKTAYVCVPCANQFKPMLHSIFCNTE